MRALAGKVHVLMLLATLTCFLAQILWSSSKKTPVGDAPIHYRFGQVILGSPLRSGEVPVWDGTMPVTALNVLAERKGAEVVFGQAQSLRQIVPNILFGSLLIVGIWSWARSFIGPREASIAALIAAFEPNILGHSRFLTTDIPSATGFFLGLVTITWFARRPSVTSLLGSAAVVSLAQLTKISNLLLFPIGVLAIIGICLATNQSWKHTIKLGAGWLCAAAIGGFLAINLAYSGVSETVERAILDPAFYRLIDREPSELTGPATRLLPIVYTTTIEVARAHNRNGHPAYLLGRHSVRGWPYYFPVAILVKTTLPLLILALVGCVAAVRKRQVYLLAMASAALAYLLVFCLLGHVNIGVRHVLAVFPALILLAGYGGAQLLQIPGRLKAAVALALLVTLGWHFYETFNAGPHYEEYFNQLAGGSNNGWKVLGDSNVQWGQDELFLREWISRQDQPVSVGPRRPVSGLIAVRADFLVGQTEQMADEFAWLRARRPIGNVTPGILIYYVR